MWADGVSQKEIAAALGWTVRKVAYQAILQKLGPHPCDCGARHRMNDAVKARVIELRNAGETMLAISEAVGFSLSSVSQFLKPLSDKRRRDRRRVKDRADPMARVVPQKVLDERDYRLSLPPRDLTAAFFGDPAPGYSALERR